MRFTVLASLAFSDGLRKLYEGFGQLMKDSTPVSRLTIWTRWTANYRSARRRGVCHRASSSKGCKSPKTISLSGRKSFAANTAPS